MNTFLNFNEAFEKAKLGKRIYREGWNNKSDMYCYIQFPDKNSKMTQPYLVLVIAGCEEGERHVPHLPSRADLFAEDWSVK